MNNKSTDTKAKGIPEAFGLFAEWYNKFFLQTKRSKPLNQLTEPFTYEFDSFVHRKYGTHYWKICVNGLKTTQYDKIGKSNIEPYHMHLYRDEWLVAIVTPNEGESIVTGDSKILYGIDKQFCSLMKKLLKKERKRNLEAESS